jgi:hypoxanthine phosphoribosyltransferase
MEKIYLSWDDVNTAADSLAHQIKKSDTTIEAITGLPRGGLIPAVLLSHKLGLPYVELLSNESEKYDSILVVDDICDSGETLKEYYQFFPTATIHYKQSAIVKPDFYYSLTPEDKWIVYPWEQKDSQTIADYATKGK